MNAGITIIKQLLLSLLLLGIIALIFIIPSYSAWHQSVIREGFADIRQMKNKPGLESRRSARYGEVLNRYRQFKKTLDSAAPGQVNRLLIPSNEYLKKHHSTVTLEEPAVIYYKSGLSTVLPYTPQSATANWALTCKEGVLDIIPLASGAAKEALIQLYRSYPKTNY
jgi:hypothetical protein